MTTVIARPSREVAPLSPGPLYNIGNVLAFATGLLVAAASRPASSGTSVWDAVSASVVGSRSALLTTTAMLVYLVSGDLYAKAFRPGTPALFARRQTRAADLLSSVGGVLLAGALVDLGNPLLAIASGTLNAGGKLGSACLEGFGIEARPWGHLAIRFCRVSPLFSRIPAVAAVVVGLVSAAGGGDFPGLVLSVVMLCCYVLWATADALLINAERS